MVRFKSFIKWFHWFELFPKWLGLPFPKWFGLSGLRVHKRFGSVRFGLKAKKPNRLYKPKTNPKPFMNSQSF